MSFKLKVSGNGAHVSERASIPYQGLLGHRSLAHVQRRALRFLAACILTIIASCDAFCAPTKPAFTNFSIIPDRNIFNTKRSPAYIPSTRPATRPRTTEAVVLTGTMHDEKGTLAFFDGSSSEYRQVLKTNDLIAGLQIVEIQHAAVKLKNGTNEITLPVNMQIAREEQGDWRVGQRSDNGTSGELAQASTSSRSPGDYSSRGDGGDRRSRSRDRRDGESRRSDRSQSEPEVTTPATSPTNAGPAPATGGSDADILEVLRRRREQENNQ
jgi:hypothetical protein